MKILHVVRQFSPGIGGIENFVYCLAREQIRQGHEVSVLTLNEIFYNREMLLSEEIIDGIPVKRIPYWGSQKYPLAFSCVKYLKGVELVHIHAVDFFVDYLAFLRPFHRKKIILHTHGGFFHTKWFLLLKKVYFHTVTRLALMACDKVIACSDGDYELFSRICRKVVKVYNGVDVEKYLKVSKQIEKGALVYIGRIDFHKRVDNLIRLTSGLVKEGLSVSLKIIGPDWRGLKPQLVELARSLGVEDKVKFLGVVSDAEIVSEMSKAQLMLFASEYEGFGIAAVEAMAAGNLCVLNKIPAFEKFVVDGDNGFLVNFNDLSEVVSKTRQIISLSESDWSRISRNARLSAGRFSWPKVASQIEEIYKECLK